MCRSQERNTIGKNIDLSWELPCATSWRFFAQATSQFFFQDNTMSRRDAATTIASLFFSFYSLWFTISLTDSENFIFLFTLAGNLLTNLFCLFISVTLSLFLTFLAIFFQCRQVSFDTHLGEKDNGPRS